MSERKCDMMARGVACARPRGHEGYHEGLVEAGLTRWGGGNPTLMVEERTHELDARYDKRAFADVFEVPERFVGREVAPELAEDVLVRGLPGDAGMIEVARDAREAVATLEQKLDIADELAEGKAIDRRLAIFRDDIQKAMSDAVRKAWRDNGGRLGNADRVRGVDRATWLDEARRRLATIEIAAESDIPAPVLAAIIAAAPADARLVTMGYDFQLNMHSMTFRSVTFPLVEEGVKPPRVDAIFNGATHEFYELKWPVRDDV